MTSETHEVTIKLPNWLYKAFSAAAVTFDKSLEDMVLDELATIADASYISSNALGDYFSTLREKSEEKAAEKGE